MSSYWIPATILDRRIDKGWFGKITYYITVKFKPEPPIVEVNPSIVELKANAENYYSMEVGTEHQIKMYRHSDGKIYPFRE
jgi:hypothetical protein